MTPGKRRERVTLRNETQDQNRRQLWAAISVQGDLIVSGRDVGPATALYSTEGSFAWTRTIAARFIPKLLHVLGASENADLLDELREHWTGKRSHELERHILDSLPECSYVDIDYDGQFIADGVLVDPATRKLSGRGWDLQAKWVRANANGGLKALIPVCDGLNLLACGGRSRIAHQLWSASYIPIGGVTQCKLPNFLRKGSGYRRTLVGCRGMDGSA